MHEALLRSRKYTAIVHDRNPATEKETRLRREAEVEETIFIKITFHYLFPKFKLFNSVLKSLRSSLQ
jgi:hypothetical protein